MVDPKCRPTDRKDDIQSYIFGYFYRSLVVSVLQSVYCMCVCVCVCVCACLHDDCQTISHLT